MKKMMRRLKSELGLAVVLTVFAGSLLPLSAAQAANPSGDLKIEIISAYNLVVDSNVTTPATYAPTAATLGAKFCNTGTNDLTDVQAYIGDFASKTPGTYPARNSASDPEFAAGQPLNYLASTGSYSLTHESGSFSSVTDASRAWIGTLKAGECRTEYWVVSYPQCMNVGGLPKAPPCTVSVTGSSGPEDDLWVKYDVWATAKDGATSLTADDSRRLTMRSELSASANKIWPNGDNKVPDEYKQVIQEVLGWDTWSSSGIPGVAYPGNVVRTQGIWYDFGNANQGFDNNGDLVPDQNAWAQPIGDPSLYDPGCFRMVRTYGLLVVKLKDGGEKLIPFVDQLYFENIPDNTGVIGLVFYEFVALNGTCSGTLSPYQEVASGNDNEKFSADYGTPLPPMMTQSPKAYIGKTASPTSIASTGGTVTYTLEVTNPDEYKDSLNNPYTLSIGDPSLGVPLVIREKIPEGSTYVAGSAQFENGKTGTILFSTDDGATWSSTAPAAGSVTDIEWRLSEPLTSDDTVAGDNKMTVSFQATMPKTGYTAPVISNTGCAAFGSGPCFSEATANVTIQGPYSISGQVFLDDGAGGGGKSNGLRDGGEVREPGAITVSLYYDVNGDGELDSGDILWGTTEATSASGYTFGSLPAKQFIVVVDDEDVNLTPGVAPTTDVEKVATITTANITGVDFGFMPPLGVTKTLTSSSPIYEGQTAAYQITVQNQLPPAGTPNGTGGCMYNAWASVESTTTAKAQAFVDPSNLFGATGPDGVYGTGEWVGGSNQEIYGGGFNSLGQQPGNIIKVEAIAQGYLSAAVTDDYGLFTIYFNNAAVAVVTPYQITNATLNSHIGKANETLFAVDVTGARTWTWSDFAGDLELKLEAAKNADADGNFFYVDGFGYRITTDQPCEASAATILNPVPLEDDYDETTLQFVSAIPPPTCANDPVNCPGKLTWSNVGPLEPGQSAAVSVTYKVIGTADASVVNTATSAAAKFADGSAANTPVTDSATVPMEATGSISGVVWTEGGGGSNGWVGTNGYEAGEAGDNLIPGVTVELYLCADADGNPAVTPADSPGNNIECADITGAAWRLSSTQVTDSNGAYHFEGLPDGYYYVKTLASTLSATAAQTGDPNVTSGTCGSNCDNIWAVNGFNGATTDLRDLPSYISSGNEDRTNINFGYTLTSPVIFGNVWNDGDGDGSRDSGENGIPGNGSTSVKVDLYDCGADTDCTGATVVASVYTDASGNYRFDTGLTAGNTYQVSVDTSTLPSGGTWMQTAESDSSVGNAIQIDNIGAGVITGSHDFGFHQAGGSSIGDTIFYDFDGDGIQDATDEGIPGITVNLYEDSNGDGVVDPLTDALVATVDTNASGGYLFSNLPAGNYIVKVDESDLTGTVSQTSDPDETGTCVTCNALGKVSVDGTSSYPNVDFGYQPKGTGSIGNFVWKDIDGDGVQDGGQETGIPGVTVTLEWDPNGDGNYVTLQTTVTSDGTVDLDGDNILDPPGSYLFNNLPEGKYRVVVSDTDPDLPKDAFGNAYTETTDTSYDVTLAAGQNVLDKDFGFAAYGAIGDTIYWDANGNGDYDLSEEGISGVTVTLYKDVNGNGIYDAGDTEYATDTTDAEGRYLFSNLPPDKYVVVVGSIVNGAPLTADPDADGVVCPAAGNGTVCDGQKAVNVRYGTSFMGADFGYQPSGVIGDQLWIDTDGDGQFDAGEVPLTGVTVELQHSGCTPGSNCPKVITDSNGQYSFANLTNGATYTVAVTDGLPSGLQPTYDKDGGNDNQTTVDATAGSINDVDFGYQYDNLNNSLSGTICQEPSDTSNGVCGESGQDTGVSANETAFSGVPVYIYKWTDDGDGIVQSKETALLQSTTTDSNGDYSFDKLPELGANEGYVISTSTPGDYLQLTTVAANTPADSVVVTSIGAYQADKTGINNGTGTSNTGYDFAYKSTVNYDYGDAPASYSTLAEDSGPRHIVPANSDDINLYIGDKPDTENNGQPSDAADADSNDGITAVGTWKEGLVTDGNGGSVTVNVTGSGWLVAWFDFDGDGSFSGAGEMIVSKAVTTGNATFNFDIPEGAFDVSQGYARFRLFPEEPAVPALAYKGTATNGEVEDIQFPLPGAKSVIGDRIWLDENGDGVQDAGEDGIAGVTVYIDDDGTPGYSAGDTQAVTDSNGNYLLKDVPAGTYSVKVDTSTLPAGLAAHPTYDEDGGADNAASVTVGSGVEYMTADFGYNWVAPTVTSNPGSTDTGAIGDRIWIDADGDGVQDPGEPGLSGVKVKLLTDDNGDGVYGGAGDNAPVEVTTNSAGNYIFTNVSAGSYVLEVDSSTLPGGTTWTQTGDPDATKDGKTTAPVILAPGDVCLQGDFGYKPASSGSVTGTVYRDVNADACGANGTCGDTGDNVLNGVDTGISGVTVVLKDTSGKIIATAVTDKDGKYNFSGVPTGSGYKVVVTDTQNVLGEVVQSGDPDSTLNNETAVTVSGAVTDVNFGYTPEGQTAGEGMIGSTVFLDRDSDGVADSGEGLEGVAVSLYKDGKLVAVTQTDENGQYQFGNLPAGTYEVRVKTTSLPNSGDGLTNTVDPNGGGDSKSLVPLGAGSHDLTQNFGYVGSNTVSGTIWDDVNADGTKADSETVGIGGVTVVLRDNNGNIVGTTVTDSSGNYSFGNLPDGAYTVDVTDEAGLLTGLWHSVGPNAGVDNNSQVSGGYSVTVSGGVEDKTADFGYYKDSTTFGGTLWNDVNSNGTLDSGETKLAHYQVVLTVTYPNGATTTLTTLTDANGDYHFDNVMLDENYNSVTGGPTYTITVPALGELISTHTPATDGANDTSGVPAADGKADDPAGEEVSGLVKGGSDFTRDFGFIGGATIGDRVWLDVNRDGIQSLNEPGLSGVTVKIYREDGNGTFESGTDTLVATVVTDGNGNYSFAGLPPGDYWVDVEETSLLGGLNATTANQGGDDALDSDLDAGATGGSMITVAAGQVIDNLDFGYVGSKPLIGDTVWFDANNNGVQDPGEAGITGVNVVIHPCGKDGICGNADDNWGPDGVSGNTDDIADVTATTDAAGHYLAPVDAGKYTVTVSTAGFNATPTNGAANRVVTVPADTDILSVDFGLTGSATNYTIGDLVWEDSNGDKTQNIGEAGIAGVTVDLYRDGIPVATTTTDANGAYSFNVAQGGTGYEVRVTDRSGILDGRTATSGSNAFAISNLSGNVDNADFGYQSLSIGDRVWLDLNGDGIQDANEPGMNGVEVELYLDSNGDGVIDSGSSPIRTETTGSDGLYNFSGLSAGKYIVKLPNSNGELDGFTATTSNSPVAVTLGASSVSNIDFGFQAPTGSGSVSGVVWEDINKDKSTTGENGIAGVTITLYLDRNNDGKLDSGDQVLGTDVTDGNGAYDFANLPVGKYLVEISGGDKLNGLYMTTDSTRLPFEITATVSLVENKNFGFASVVPTYALISSFKAYVNDDGQTVLEWKTDSEVGTIGFLLERQNKQTGDYETVSDLLPGMLLPPQGGSYRFVDLSAEPNQQHVYRVQEVTVNGDGMVSGPYTVTPKQPLPINRQMFADGPAGFTLAQADFSAKQISRFAARKEAARSLAAEKKSKTGDTVKVPVSKDGLVYLTADELATASGLRKAEVTQYLKNGKIAVTLAGEPVSALSSAVGSALWFYGHAPERNDIGQNIYLLELGKKKGAEIKNGHKRAKKKADNLQSFTAQVKAEENHMPFHLYINKPVRDFWAWEYLLAYKTEAAKVHNVSAPHLTGEGMAVVTVNLTAISSSKSGSEAPYKVSVLLNGTSLGVAEWSETGDYQFRAEVPADQLREEGNEVKLVSQLNSGVKYSLIYLDSIEVEYQRQAQAVNGELTFSSSEDGSMTISGFSSRTVLALDITDPDKPVRIYPTVEEDTVTVPTEAEHRYFLTQNITATVSGELAVDAPSSLRDQSNRADYLIISPLHLLESARRLAEYRETQGLQVMVVDIDDVQDEFSSSLAAPEAVRDFLAYVYKNWAKVPHYAVLVGDGSYDYKNYLGAGWPLVPTVLTATPEGYFPSDNVLADVVGDDKVPEFAIGRIPVIDNQEFTAYIDKLIAYEQTAGQGGTLSIVVDKTDPAAGDFQASADKVAVLAPSGFTVKRIAVDTLGESGTHREIIKVLQQGGGILHYVGHSSLVAYGRKGSLFTAEGLATMSDLSKPMLMVSMSCLSANIGYPLMNSIGESAVLKKGGAAVAFFGATGLSYNYFADIMADGFYSSLSKPEVVSIGDAVLRAKQQYAEQEAVQHPLDIYNLLGDPAALVPAAQH